MSTTETDIQRTTARRRSGPPATLRDSFANAQPARQERTVNDLTAAERRVLAVLSDPSFYGKTETERIKAAGISRARYYQLIRDPSFHAIQRQQVQETIQQNISAIVDKSIQQAVTTGRDGFADRKLLAEWGRFYTPHSQVDHNVKGTLVGIVGIKVDDV